jgi:hypothetical protein
VGALNMHNTVARSDGTMTRSSKGSTVINGLIKPDIVAPGNEIVSAKALGSMLVANYPAIHAVGTGEGAYAAHNTRRPQTHSVQTIAHRCVQWLNVPKCPSTTLASRSSQPVPTDDGQSPSADQPATIDCGRTHDDGPFSRYR